MCLPCVGCHRLQQRSVVRFLTTRAPVPVVSCLRELPCPACARACACAEGDAQRDDPATAPHVQAAPWEPQHHKRPTHGTIDTLGTCAGACRQVACLHHSGVCARACMLVLVNNTRAMPCTWVPWCRKMAIMVPGTKNMSRLCSCTACVPVSYVFLCVARGPAAPLVCCF